MNAKRILSALFILTMLSSAAFAGTTGKIAGVVTDAENGEPLPGVNIMIVGTTIGAATNIAGEFFIINVPPGTYTLRANLIGYRPVEMTDVVVKIDLTTNVDFKLTTETIDLGTVTVQAERAIVEPGITTSKTYFGANEMVNMPVVDVQDVAALTAGSVQGSFRGSRHGGGEVIYVVDGVSLANPLGDSYTGYKPGAGGDEALATNLPRESVAEAEVMTGGFTAEYPSVQSAIINIVTKEGGSRFTGKLKATASPEVVFGVDKGVRHDIVYGWEERTNRQDTTKIDTVQVPHDLDGRSDYYDTRRYEFSFGGPVPIEKMEIPGKASFFVSGDFYSWGSENLAITPSAHPAALYWNSDDINSFRGKFTWEPSASKKITFNYLRSVQNPSRWRHDFSQRITTGDTISWWDGNAWQEVVVPYVYNADQTDSIAVTNYSMLNNLPEYQMWSNEVSLSFTHNINPKTFYTLVGSRFYTGQQVRALDPYDGHPLTYDEMGQDRFDPLIKQEHNYWYINPNFILRTRQDDSQIIYTMKGDLTSQVDTKNLVKLGFEVKQYDLMVDYLSRASGGNNYKSQYHVRPVGAGAYIQDKIETRGMIFSFGARLDFFDPKTWVPYNPANPVKEEYNDKETGSIWDVKERLENPQRAKKKYQVSPRLGVSFPITDRDVLRFSYGHYFQLPIFDEFYNNQAYDLSGAHKYAGNANLEEQKTIAYEAGVEHAFTNDLKLSVTGFYKDISGLVNFETYVDPSLGTRFRVFGNSDYARVKGFELTLTQRPWRGISGQVAYTYSIATGKSSDNNSGFLDNYYGRKPRTEEWPLDWDQRHTVNAVASYEVPKDWGPVFFNNHVLGDWYVSTVISYNSGVPFSSGNNPPVPELPPINDMRYPASYNVDLRLEKGFSIWKTWRSAFFVEIFNVTDAKNLVNIIEVERYLVSKDWKESDPERSKQEFGGEVDANGQFDNPIAWSEPRRIMLGVQVEF